MFEIPRIEKARMRIKAGQHAIDRTLDQRLIIDLVDIVATYTLKHVHKLIERAIAIPLSLSERSSGRGHERQRPGKCGGLENSFRSEAPPSELQSLMRNHNAVICL